MPSRLSSASSELGSFTRAAETMRRTTQAAVSLKLKRLEERLGWRLVERTARYVQLSARGAAFLERARELLEVHDRALAVFAVTPAYIAFRLEVETSANALAAK
jgi:DNA-binding transcriptional LysR family regulator